MSARSGKCKTDLNTFDIGPGIPGPSMPGFGLNISVPGLDIPFPEGFPENIFDLLNKLKFKWPLGLDLSSMLDNFMKKLSQLISNILTQISAFLALYNVLMAIIQMIVCIIEVLCGLIRKAPKKLRRLFRKCMPIFLSIFPFLALLALILAIIALILALIEYIIGIIKKIWDELKRNYDNLVKATKREQSPNKSAAIIAITRKIASILCVLENIMLLFLIILGIIEIIKGILSNSINLPCDDRDTATNDCGDCSSCSELIISPQTISNYGAVLTYSATPTLFGNPGDIGSLILSAPDPAEVITMTADSLASIQQGQFTFANLLSSTYKGYAVGPFFPPAPLDDTYTYTMAPYTIDLDIVYTSSEGARTVTIKNIVVKNITTSSSTNGTLTLVGGSASDPLEEVNGKNLLFFFNNGVTPSPFAVVPATNKSCTINSFNPNYDILPVIGLTTFDCNPDIINDKLALYSTIDPHILDGIVFPDIQGALDSYTSATSKLRSKINDASIDEFRDTMNSIMNKLKAESESTYGQAVQAMINPLYSTATLDPEVQFVGKPIQVTLIFKNASKQSFKDIAGDSQMPAQVQSDIISKVSHNISLGRLDEFAYDSTTGNFVANITSSNPGDGVLKLYYDGQQLGQLVAPTNLDEPSAIEPLEFPYTFIGGTTTSAGDGAIRRDETDTANQ